MKIKSALIQFNEHGTPVASEFDDVYFSNDDGAAETEHVFIAGNRLLARFEAHQNPRFVIAETGFGTGLNCALAMAKFAEFKQTHPSHPLKHLHIISVEKFPLSKQDLTLALAAQPTSPAFKDALLKQYPMSLAGAHRLEFGSATLDLWLGEAIDTFEQNLIPSKIKVDAWFLDGFAPSKNPDMWTQRLFDAMAMLSKEGTTLATFTAAGFVRRGLIAAGFEMQKVAGFGRKREMLTGVFRRESCANTADNPDTHPRHVAILGAGLAGANLAYSLAKRGCAVTVIDKHNIASGASGNPQGGFYPQLHAQVSNPSLIQAHSFLYARRRYDQLIECGADFAHAFCGTLLLGFSDAVALRQKKMQENSPWPYALTQFVDAHTASTIANVSLPHDGIFIADAGWISPPELVHALLNEAKKHADIRVLTEQIVQNVSFTEQQVEIKTAQHQVCADVLIVATGAGEHDIAPIAALPFGRTRGQVESIPASAQSTQLKTVLCHKGYFTPALQGRHALGSTYARNDDTVDYKISDAETNLATHKKALPDADFLQTLQHDYQGRAAVRMTLPDHQPAVGMVDDEGYFARLGVLCGLGSRGLTTAPLMAEVLTAELFNEPVPLAHALHDAIDHKRFAKRAQKRAGN